MKAYTFTVYLTGYGNTPDEAWDEIAESTNFQDEDTPMSYTEEEVEDTP